MRANSGTALGYGGDEWTARLQDRFGELFETSVRVFPVATGTAANALSLAAIGPGWGNIYCSEAAHINTSEANAAGFLGGGLKLVPVAGTYGRIDPAALRETLAALDPAALHRGKPSGVNITQASDLGAVYSTRRHPRHRRGRQGARAQGAHGRGAVRQRGGAARRQPGRDELALRRGHHVLRRDQERRGAVRCDRRVQPGAGRCRSAWNLRRAGQVWSKMRFASAQLMAYIEDGLWLRLAQASNAAAARIAAGIEGLPGLRLIAPVQANEIFLELPGTGRWTRWNRTGSSSIAAAGRWRASSAAST